MAIERTLSIIKPDAVQNKVVGKILSRFEENGLNIKMTTMSWLVKEQAEAFYEIHKDQPFFERLVEFMLSGPVVLSILEGENAVAHHRELIGATDPKNAKPGTIRADFAEGIPNNAVHGSDSVENAYREINFFFALQP